MCCSFFGFVLSLVFGFRFLFSCGLVVVVEHFSGIIFLSDLLDCGAFWFARNLAGKAKSYCILIGNESVGKVKIKLNILRDSMVS